MISVKDKKKESAIKLRGRVFTGTVLKAKVHKSAVVTWSRKKLIKKYERYEKRRTKVNVHNPIEAKEGDLVKISECRPLSKTKHFVITEIMGKDRTFMEKMRMKEEGRMKATEREITHKKEEQEKKDAGSKSKDNKSVTG
ncbi:MAG: 30S ribosomal protein S17 [Nanoarchaeota archaeon]|nr:30S ribosomal protein S17 [Nanoarchaeota archaeon]